MRACVLDRDHGICAFCNFDGATADYKINQLREAFIEQSRYRYGSLSWLMAKRYLETYLEELSRLGFRFKKEQFFRPGSRKMRSLWEADHIVAVIDGGGECGLDNVATLCLVCHSKKSAELRKRLRQQRRLECPIT